MDTNLFTQVIGHWEAVIDDMEATAAEYREAGWTVIELHPGDVTVLDDDLVGFDVLIPDDEFDRLETTVDDATLDETEVFRADRGGIIFALAVVRDAKEEVAVCCPLYYDEEGATTLRKWAEQTGQIDTYVRTLTSDQAVTISHDDTEPFLTERQEE